MNDSANFLHIPAPRHVFEPGAEDEFQCRICHRPRCIHPGVERTVAENAPIRQPMRSRWPDDMVLGELTDRKIEQYRKEGWYSAALRQARREYQERKRKIRRQGSFLVMEDGRLVFAPE